jgi:YD repeat-containing protein
LPTVCTPHIDSPVSTNPANGTVNYTYNAERTLLTKKDANNNMVTHGYDQYQRLTIISDPPQTFGGGS